MPASAGILFLWPFEKVICLGKFCRLADILASVTGAGAALGRLAWRKGGTFGEKGGTSGGKGGTFSGKGGTFGKKGGALSGGCGSGDRGQVNAHILFAGSIEITAGNV